MVQTSGFSFPEVRDAARHPGLVLFGPPTRLIRPPVAGGGRSRTPGPDARPHGRQAPDAALEVEPVGVPPAVVPTASEAAGDRDRDAADRTGGGARAAGGGA